MTTIYTKEQIKSSLQKCLEILDTPVKPCRCSIYERCNCERNELISLINSTYNIIEDILNPNENRKAEIEITKLTT